MPAKVLIFADCETTGLDEKKDHIVELGLVAVELPTFREIACFDMVATPPLWPTVERNMHEKVRLMHSASGLLYDIATRAKASAADVEREALAFVRQWAPHTQSWHTPMGGSNPDFDRRFIRARMPALHSAFHYRNFDVRAFTQLQDWVFGVAHTESPHRALADARKSVQDVRTFLGLS